MIINMQIIKFNYRNISFLLKKNTLKINLKISSFKRYSLEDKDFPLVILLTFFSIKGVTSLPVTPSALKNTSFKNWLQYLI